MSDPPAIVDDGDAHRLKRAAVEDRLYAEFERIDPFDAFIIVMGVAVRVMRRAGVQRHAFIRHASELWDAVT